jgi:hypothetical protein
MAAVKGAKNSEDQTFLEETAVFMRPAARSMLSDRIHHYQQQKTAGWS